jgi:hypothetical protein
MCHAECLRHCGGFILGFLESLVRRIRDITPFRPLLIYANDLDFFATLNCRSGEGDEILFIIIRRDMLPHVPGCLIRRLAQASLH